VGCESVWVLSLVGSESVWVLSLVEYSAVCVSDGALQTQNGKQRSPAAGQYKLQYIKQEYRIPEEGLGWRSG
jgi:hypothetical protein